MGIKFGTDGWRAVIGKDFTFENIRILSQAIADYLKANKRRDLKVTVGYDCRFLSKEFAYEVSCVLCANKIRVFLSSGALPTPLLSFTTKKSKSDLGIMITASHNPYYFNGLKIKTPQGGAADKEITDRIEKLLFKNKVHFISQEEARKKELLIIKDFSPDYIKFIKEYIDTSLIRKRKLRILVDLMYGSGDSYMEEIFGEKDKVLFSYLHREFNPSFGGRSPEPTQENLKELRVQMKKGDFDLGIALDGDADRIACVLRGGRYINAQIILPLLALHLARNKRLSGGIVKTIVGSNLIDSVSLSLSRILYETPVGFKHISKLFQSEDILIGGEEAGGIGFKNYIPERDGTMAGLLLLEMIGKENKTLEELINKLEKDFGKWSYIRKAIPLKRVKKSILDKIRIPKKLLGRKVERVNRLDGVKIITSSSWLMFRVSGTEPILRLYAEAPSKREAQRLLLQGEEIINAL